MPYTITINDNSPAAMNFVKFAKSLDFTTVTKTKEAKKTATIAEELEEDEDGIPIKYRDEIMALSKKVNKAVAKRWDEALTKRSKKQTV